MLCSNKKRWRDQLAYVASLVQNNVLTSLVYWFRSDHPNFWNQLESKDMVVLDIFSFAGVELLIYISRVIEEKNGFSRPSACYLSIATWGWLEPTAVHESFLEHTHRLVGLKISYTRVSKSTRDFMVIESCCRCIKLWGVHWFQQRFNYVPTTYRFCKQPIQIVLCVLIFHQVPNYRAKKL
jgi:hypothetical protein